MKVTELVEVDEWRAYTLFDLASFLPEEKRSAIMSEALQAARQVEDIHTRAQTLIGIMDSLPDDLRSDIVRESMMAINAQS